jgi:HemY protein
VSPSGGLDAFEWRVPVIEVPAVSAGIEPARIPVAVAMAPTATAGEPIREGVPAVLEKPAAGEKAEVSPAVAESVGNAPALRRVLPPPKPEAVIPLVHAPDDPGPDAVDESEQLTKPQNGGWRKIFE